MKSLGKSVIFEQTIITMSQLNEIKKPVEKEILQFEEYLKKSMKSDELFMDMVMRYILKTKGKQIRPMFVLLSAKLQGPITEKSYIAASLIELLHTATLIHDDVVDESFERRNHFSVNALWRTKIAVLAGDFLLSKGLLISINTQTHDLLETVSEAVKLMSEGELMQFYTARKRNITEEKYFDIISRKTASLISSCTLCGALSVTNDTERLAKMKEFGRLAGMAFQIRDDLFDFLPDASTGKPIGTDIRDKKMTLPVIYAINTLDSETKKKLKQLMNKKQSNKQTMNDIYEIMNNSGAIEYTRSVMNRFKNEAISMLDDFEENEAKKSLIALVNFCIERKQ
jgi:octaprenyl-diphosphate synthase